MATFISTVRFSDQGIQAAGQTTKRAASIRDSASSLGVTIKEIYWTMGDLDGLLVMQAPDAQTAAAMMLKVGAEGNVHSSTSRAFSAEEMDHVLKQAGL